MTRQELQRAAARLSSFSAHRPPPGTPGRDVLAILEDWKRNDARLEKIALRCGYILGTCRGEEEMRAEARAILALLEE